MKSTNIQIFFWISCKEFCIQNDMARLLARKFMVVDCIWYRQMRRISKILWNPCKPQNLRFIIFMDYIYGYYYTYTKLVTCPITVLLMRFLEVSYIRNKTILYLHRRSSGLLVFYWIYSRIGMHWNFKNLTIPPTNSTYSQFQKTNSDIGSYPVVVDYHFHACIGLFLSFYDIAQHTN